MYNGFKLGWARVNFNYFISPEELDFICKAILQIAEHGWKLIPLYQVDLKSGLFVHKGESSVLNRPSLNDFQFIPSTVGVKAKIKPQSFQQVLDDAKNIYGTTDKFLRLFGGDDVGAIVESFPSGIVPQDDVWWVTTRDVMESLKAQKRGIKSTNALQDAWSIALEA